MTLSVSPSKGEASLEMFFKDYAIYMSKKSWATVARARHHLTASLTLSAVKRKSLPSGRASGGTGALPA